MKFTSEYTQKTVLSVLHGFLDRGELFIIVFEGLLRRPILEEFSGGCALVPVQLNVHPSSRQGFLIGR